MMLNKSSEGMACKHTVADLFVSLLIYVTLVQCITLHNSFHSSSPVLFHHDPLTLECAPGYPLDQSDRINFFELYRNYSGLLVQILTSAFINNASINYQSVTWHDLGYKSRASTNGSATYPFTEAKLVFSILPDDVECGDAGSYVCAIDFITSNAYNVQSSLSVELKVEPSAIDIRHKGVFDTCKVYLPGAIIRLECSVTVGDPDYPLQWCYKRFGLDNTYIRYHGNVSQNSTALNACQYTIVSALTYYANEAVSEVDFRCAVGLNTTCENTAHSLSKEYRVLIRK